MEDIITIIDENNNERVGYLLAKINYKDKDYIIYTDNHKNESGNMRLLASRIEIIDGKIHIYKIETEEEWEYIEKIIKTFGDE